MDNNKMINTTTFLAVLLCLSVVASTDDSSSLAQKCAAQFQKVAMCLPFATAKAPAPTKECCTSAEDLKESDPACLCYIIQQIHSGSSEAIKNMGVQESRLLQLPSACKLVNASVAECPRLLHLAPNSPDAAIFTNVSTAASNTTTPVATPGTSSPMPHSNGFWYKPQLAQCTIIAIAIAIFFLVFPLGLPSS